MGRRKNTLRRAVSLRQHGALVFIVKRHTLDLSIHGQRDYCEKRWFVRCHAGS